ncbi:MAG: DUF3726 domain-containing protein [Bordetella sp.]|nr:MAG: DUF3726 domain-containing protein [Bordetella sp.]
MIVSHNELIATVNKAFLGMRRKCGEADIIANMVADLQIVKLDGVRHFNNAISFIKLEEDFPIQIELINEQNVLKTDLHGRSVACHIPIIIDSILEKFFSDKKSNLLKIEINNCHNRWLVYNQLEYLSSKGLSCIAKWNNGSSPRKILCCFDSNSSFPNFYFSEKLFNLEDSLHNLVIEISKNNLSVERFSNSYENHLSSTSLEIIHQGSWKDGIFVEDSDWKALKNNSLSILVQDSAKSALGAGELQVDQIIAL